MHWKCIGLTRTESPLLQEEIISLQIRWTAMMLQVFFHHLLCNVTCTPCSIPDRPKVLTPVSIKATGGYSCCSRREVLPLSRFTMSLIAFEAGYSICMWTWSLLTAPLRILMSSASQIWIISSRHRFWTSPLRT
jgi:hypothetical protein